MNKYFIQFLTISICLSAYSALQAQSLQVYFVLLDTLSPKDIPLIYTPSFDREEITLTYGQEDTLNMLSEFINEEDELFGPECFVPELKLIFKEYTYVLSMYCTRAIKFQNYDDYKASSKMIKNDLFFTHSIFAFLTRLKQKHFDEISPNQALIERIITDPLEVLPDDVEDLDMLLDESADTDDRELTSPSITSQTLDLASEEIETAIKEEMQLMEEKREKEASQQQELKRPQVQKKKRKRKRN